MLRYPDRSKVRELTDEPADSSRAQTSTGVKRQLSIYATYDPAGGTCYREQNGDIIFCLLDGITVTGEKPADGDHEGAENHKFEQDWPSGGGAGDHGGPPPPDPCTTANPPDYCSDTAADTWERQNIDDSQLKPCMRKAMSDLKEDYMGVGPIIQEFAGKTPGFNGVTKDGNLSKNVNGATSTQYDKSTHTVTTTFDTGKFSNATGISVAEVYSP